MKHCPQCQTSYTDESLKYCTRDGAPLESSTDAQTVAFNEEATVISSRQVEPIRVQIDDSPPQQNWQPTQTPPQNWQQNQPPQSPQQQNWQQIPPPQQQPPIAVAPPVKKSRTGLAVGLTALAMLALFGIAGALYLARDKKTEVAVNVNNAQSTPVNRPSPNQNANANANVAITPTATPTPKPTLDPNQAKTITAEVGGVVDEWKNSTENLDIDAHVGQYAPTVDYYKGGKVSAARIRADRQRAFDTYGTMVVNISNMKVTPDASGDKAVAVFDKEWDFTGEDKYSTGKVQQQLTFAKIGGNWKITGEKDLKLYYKE